MMGSLFQMCNNCGSIYKSLKRSTCPKLSKGGDEDACEGKLLPLSRSWIPSIQELNLSGAYIRSNRVEYFREGTDRWEANQSVFDSTMFYTHDISHMSELFSIVLPRDVVFENVIRYLKSSSGFTKVCTNSFRFKLEVRSGNVMIQVPREIDGRLELTICHKQSSVEPEDEYYQVLIDDIRFAMIVVSDLLNSKKLVDSKVVYRHSDPSEELERSLWTRSTTQTNYDLYDFIVNAEYKFSISDVRRYLELTKPIDKKTVDEILKYFTHKGLLEQSTYKGTRYWRPTGSDLKVKSTTKTRKQNTAKNWIYETRRTHLNLKDFIKTLLGKESFTVKELHNWLGMSSLTARNIANNFVERGMLTRSKRKGVFRYFIVHR